MSEDTLQKVDHGAIKFNQVTIIALNVFSFILNSPLLASLVAATLLIGVVRKAPGFDFLYKYIFKPARLVEPDIINDHPEPHRFAQLLGGIFTAAGSLCLFFGLTVVGWVLVWAVAILAALNVYVGFCAGCAIYYWLNRLNMPGFTKAPPSGTTPGMRPKDG